MPTRSPVISLTMNRSAAKPNSTNSPVPSSMARVCRMSLEGPSEHECSQDEIENQHDHRGNHHRARSRAAHPFSGRLRIVTLIHGYQAARDTEYDALQQALADVVQLHGRTHLRPEASR